MGTRQSPILFFSDAHLGAHDPVREAVKVDRFVSFLKYAGDIQAEVFFLGDLFDFWFEYKHWVPKVPVRALAAIRQFTAQGGTFDMLLGNHDIWAADYFAVELGATVHKGDLTATRQGLRILISHGDGKAKSDRGYRVLRRVLRFGPNITLYKMLPADWAFALANFSSRRSRELTSSRSPKFVTEYEAVAQARLTEGYNAVIMGHIHQGWVKRLGGGWWVNTGEFFENFDYVLLNDGEFHLKTWSGTPDADFSN